ncbi:hypothetical protein BGZ94_005555, partial [Podila epigama]
MTNEPSQQEQEQQHQNQQQQQHHQHQHQDQPHYPSSLYPQGDTFSRKGSAEPSELHPDHGPNQDQVMLPTASTGGQFTHHHPLTKPRFQQHSQTVKQLAPGHDFKREMRPHDDYANVDKDEEEVLKPSEHDLDPEPEHVFEQEQGRALTTTQRTMRMDEDDKEQ